jgi:hypothetical protein
MRINMGPEIDLKRNNPKSQPHGYWEDQSFVSINRQIIKAAGGHWHKPPGRLKILTASIEFRDQINTLLEKRNEAENWGWKDPRNCLCIEAYQYVLSQLDDVRYLQIIRDKDAVVGSLDRREQKAENWAKVIYEHERRVRDFFNRYQVSRYTVSYEDILKHPEYEIRRLGEFLNVSDLDLILLATRRIKR